MKSIKTFEEWGEYLEEPIKSAYLNNLKELPKYDADASLNTMQDAIMNAFVWDADKKSNIKWSIEFDKTKNFKFPKEIIYEIY